MYLLSRGNSDANITNMSDNCPFLGRLVVGFIWIERGVKHNAAAYCADLPRPRIPRILRAKKIGIISCTDPLVDTFK